MNNLRLLIVSLGVTLLSGGVCASDSTGRVFTIEELFTMAESNSTQLKPFFAAEDVADKEIAVARSNRLPDINTTLNFSFIGNGFTTKRDFSDSHKAAIPHFGNGFSVGVTQPVYAGGAISKGIELAELKSTASRFSTELQRDNIRFRLAGFYLDIYKYRNLRKVVEGGIGRARKLLSEMKSRYEQGLALQNDITRYELLLSDLELQLVRINNTLDIMNNNLAVLAGLPTSTVILPDTTLLERSLPVSGESIWQQEAEVNSPSLRLARSGVDISRKAEDLVKSERLPKVGLQAGWTIDGPILVEVPPINRNLSYWYVGVGISYDLSSIYKSNKSLSKSRAATRMAIEQLDAAAENLSLEIRSDYIRYLEANEELKTQNKRVELAEKNYRTTYTRYITGMALITDMLDAANSRLDAEQQLVNARINIIYNYYKLLFTSGKI